MADPRIATHIGLSFHGTVRNTRFPVAWAAWWLLRAALRHPVRTLASVQAVRRGTARDRYYVQMYVNGREVFAWRARRAEEVVDG